MTGRLLAYFCTTAITRRRIKCRAWVGGMGAEGQPLSKIAIVGMELEQPSTYNKT
jgi:hypothetical protein